MARGLISGRIDDLNGNVRSNTSITIRSRTTGLPAALYSTALDSTTVSNPVVTNSSGRFSVWAERGPYSVDVPAGSGVPAYTRFIEATPSNDGGVDPAWLQPLTLAPSSLPTIPYPDQRSKVVVTASSAAASAGTVADTTTWEFQWDAALSRWRFIGGAPLSLTINGWPELGAPGNIIMSATLPATSDYQMTVSSSGQGLTGVYTSSDWTWRQSGSAGSKLLRNTGYSQGAYGYSNLAGFVTMNYTVGKGPAVVHVQRWNGTDLNNVAVVLTFSILPALVLYK